MTGNGMNITGNVRTCPKDNHKQLSNGRILAVILKRHALIVVNGLKGKSKGLITRSRSTVEGEERSTIDFVILSYDMVEELVSIETDEDKVNCLTSISKTKKGVKVTKSDHNTIITQFGVKWDKQLKKEKVELFNIKNPEGQQKFKEMTSIKGLFTNIFDDKSQNVNYNKQIPKEAKQMSPQVF